MRERRPFFRHPKWQMVLAIILVIVVYFYFSGSQGVARDVVLKNGYAFVAVGKDGGVRFVNVQDPQNPFEAGFFDTVGAASSLTQVGDLLFIADGERGVPVVSVADPGGAAMVGHFATAGDVRRIAVVGNYAYLATHEVGLQIVDISNLQRPVLVSAIEIPGDPKDIAIAYPYAFIAAGNRGLQVLDVQFPFYPTLIGSLDTPGEAHSVKIVGTFALVADGRGGLKIINISNPSDPAEVGSLDTPGEAKDLALAGSLAYVADGERGLLVVDVMNPLEPTRVGSISVRGDVQRVVLSATHAYVAAGIQGVRVLDITSPTTPVEVGFYETPGEATFGQILSAGRNIMSRQISQVQSKVWRTLLVYVLDLVLFSVALVFWVAFFAQFILPVHTLNERREAIRRLFAYFSGGHGPAIFIEDGEVRQRKREGQRRGPGVALLDTASAAVFRNAHAFTRAAGPGIVFTDASERLAGTVDLHVQSQSLGPNEREDPFQPRKDKEPPEVFEEREKRRYDTSALTRDGVEVVPNVSAIFRLNTVPGEGRTQFGYSPQPVWRAIAREGVYADGPNNTDSHHVGWRWLPVQLAVDLWREYLRKFTLDELFAFPENVEPEERVHRRKTAFVTIAELVQARMVEEEVVELDEFGRHTPFLKPSKEFKILQERGLRVIAVSISNLRFPSEVEEQLIRQWEATWLQRAQSESEDVDQLHAHERSTAEELALMEFAAGASQPLGNLLVDGSESKRSLNLAESLEKLVRGTLRLAQREPNLHQYMTTQRNQLIDLVEWIRKQ